MPPFYRPSSILSHPLLGGTSLQRELGLGVGIIQDPLLAWASGLERKIASNYYYHEILDFVLDKDIGCTIQFLAGPSSDNICTVQYVYVLSLKSLL